MNVKRYFAEDMQEALDKIKKELGPDAVILSSRTMRKKGVMGIFSKPLVEVVVAYEQGVETQFSKALSVAGGNAAEAKVEIPAAARAKRADSTRKSVEKQADSKSNIAQVIKKAEQTADGFIPFDLSTKSPKKAQAADNTPPPLRQNQPSLSEEPRKSVPQPAESGGMASAISAAPVPAEGIAAAAPEFVRPVEVARSANLRSEASRMEAPKAEQLRPEPLRKEPPKTEPLRSSTLRRAPAQQTRAERRPVEDMEDTGSKLLGMERRIVEMQSMLLHLSQKRTPNPSGDIYPESIEQLYMKLRDSEVHESIARGLANETQEIVEKLSANPAEVMRQLVNDKLGKPSPLNLKPYQRNVVVMCGPTGVGKTTTLVKLAAYFAYRKNAKIAMINNDTYRVGAQEQLNTYAEILSAPVHITYTTDDVVDALNELTGYDLVFIDTSGRNPGDEQYKHEMSQLVRRCRADEIFLVISASTGVGTCREIIRNYAYLNQYKLLVTKTDETLTGGMILNAVAFSGMPLSYITTGQSVPDDIEVAEPKNIAQKILD